MTDCTDSRLPVWCEGDEWCAVFATTSIIGRKWHLAIMNRLVKNGDMGFSELKRAVGAGISAKMLSSSLDDLEEKGLVDREVVQDKPVRVQYRATERGMSLTPVIDEIVKWGKEHLKPATSEDSSIV